MENISELFEQKCERIKAFDSQIRELKTLIYAKPVRLRGKLLLSIAIIERKRDEMCRLLIQLKNTQTK